MNIGLFSKTAYEQKWAWLAVSVGVMLFPALIINAFSTMPWDLMQQFMARAPWIARIFKALTGSDFSDMMSPNTLGAFAFIHPVVLALTWGFVVMSTTRVICGEIDQGTADMLLALPVSRTSAYVSVSAWVFLCVPSFIACLWFGVWIGARTADLPTDLQPWALRHVAACAVACLWAVAGIGMFFSALGSRRGTIVGVVFAILVSTFLINALAAFWPRIQSLAAFSLLRYFRPFVIIREGRFPAADIAVLLTVAVVAWIAGALVFARRDIQSV